MENSFDLIQNFFSQKYGIDKKNLNPETILWDDLGFYGDDIDGIILDFSQHFNIDVSNIDIRNFNIGNEPFDFLTPLLKFFKKKNKVTKPKICLKDFEKILEKSKENLSDNI